MPLHPWQVPQWQQLQMARAEGRFPHALMITGTQGLGKVDFAEWLAASLLCREPAPDGQPCGQCRACRFLAAGSHPDFRRIEPEGEGRPIRVEAIRDFTAWSVVTPQEGDHRVTLIFPADSMNAAAANSLLKTLEEPVSGNHILLITSQPATLPATVRSRCQRILLRAPSADEVESWLRRQSGDGPWQLLLRVARNAPLEAIQLAREEILPVRAAVFEEFRGLWSPRGDPLAMAANWNAGDLRRILAWLAAWLRDIVRLGLGGEAETLENPDLATSLQDLAKSLDLRKCLDVQRELESAANNWPRKNLNTQMQLERLLVDLVDSRR